VDIRAEREIHCDLPGDHKRAASAGADELWSIDEKIMYYVDSLTHGLDAFDFTAETGQVRDRRRVADIPDSLGIPDGITLDEQGFIWVALHGGNAVHRYSPEGLLERRIELPVSLVTSCSFGGPNLDDLYITSAVDPDRHEPLAGSIFCYRSDVAGRTGHLCKF